MEEEDVIEGSTTRCSANLANANVITSLKRATPIERKKRCRSASQLRTHHKNTQKIRREEITVTTNIDTGKENRNNYSNNNKSMMSNETNAITNSNLRVSKQDNRSASEPSAKRKRVIDDSNNVNNADECNHNNITTGVSHLDNLYSIIFDKHIDQEEISCKDNDTQKSNSLPQENNHHTCESKENEQGELVINVTPEIEEEKQDQREEEQLESQHQRGKEYNESNETEKETDMLNDVRTSGSDKEKTYTTVDDSIITTSAEHIPPVILSNDLFQEELEEEEEEEQHEELRQEQNQSEQQEYYYQEYEELHEELEQTVEEEQEEEQECVERPQVIESEDYYFCLPQPAHLNKLTSLQQDNSGMSKISVVQNVGLGRVMSVQLSKINEQEIQHSTERPINSSRLSQWTVTMRTYETSQVTLRHNPISNEIESQTRVFLSNKEITIPVSCLLFDIPVYVIDAAMMKHVYILDESPITPLSPSPIIHKETENWHETQQQQEQNKCNDNDNIFNSNSTNNLMTCLDPTSPERFHASTIPVTQSTRAVESTYGANCNNNLMKNNNNNNSSTIECNSTNLEYHSECEELQDVKEEEQEMWERQSKSNKVNNNFEVNNVNNDNGDDNEENEDSILMLDPRRTTALPHEGKCSSKDMIVANNSNSNNKKDANPNLASLTFPSSSSSPSPPSSSVIPRAFHSRFTLPATFTPRHGSVIDEVHVCGLIIRDGSLVRFRHHY